MNEAKVVYVVVAGQGFTGEDRSLLPAKVAGAVCFEGVPAPEARGIAAVLGVQPAMATDVLATLGKIPTNSVAIATAEQVDFLVVAADEWVRAHRPADQSVLPEERRPLMRGGLATLESTVFSARMTGNELTSIWPVTSTHPSHFAIG